jgi:hypothetical protein
MQNSMPPTTAPTALTILDASVIAEEKVNVEKILAARRRLLEARQAYVLMLPVMPAMAMIVDADRTKAVDWPSNRDDTDKLLEGIMSLLAAAGVDETDRNAARAAMDEYPRLPGFFSGQNIRLQGLIKDGCPTALAIEATRSPGLMAKLTHALRAEAERTMRAEQAMNEARVDAEAAITV